MRRVLRFQPLFFSALGLVLLYVALKDQNHKALLHVLKSVDYRWAFVVSLITLSTHLVRAARWQLLIDTLGKKPALHRCFFSLMIGYLANYAVPRLGELSRCSVLKKTDKLSFSALLGTVVVERAIDIFSLGLMFILAFLLSFQKMRDFFLDNILMPFTQIIGHKTITIKLFLSITYLTLPFLMVVLYILYRVSFVQKYAIPKLKELWRDMCWGIQAIGHTKKTLFFLYTLLIWLGYAGMSYFWFFAIPTMSALGIKVGFVLMIIGSMGRSIPIQGGGIGAYHYLVTQAAVIFGVQTLYGNAFAILNHGFQAVYSIMLGGLSILWFLRSSTRIAEYC